MPASEPSSEAQALRMLFFAGYYLSKRSYDGEWHDAGDEDAYEIVRESMRRIHEETHTTLHTFLERSRRG